MTEPTDGPDIRSSSDSEDDDPGWPLSFILLVVAGGLYLVLRFFQMARGLLT
jgi:hypothetical protein